MSSRGTAIDRVLTFYRTASSDTVRVTHQLAVEVMAQRKIGAPAVRKARKPKQASGASAGAAAAGSGGN